MSSPREIPYAEAVGEATWQAMQDDASIFVYGPGVPDPKGVFGTTLEAAKRFPKRVLDTPLSEAMLTGAAVGAALTGSRPLLVHARADFLLVTLDQLLNHAAKWRYMHGGRMKVPVVVRAVVGKGWGQAAQHSQALHATLAHYPGIKVAVPSNGYDAKGLLLSALRGDDPAVILEHRNLHNTVCDVPAGAYTLPFGAGRIVKDGDDVTLVATSAMVPAALEAAKALLKDGISAQVVDPRTIKPLDATLILNCLAKTRRLVVADGDWAFCGFSAEVAALAAERAFHLLKAPVARVTWPDAPVPCARELESAFYPGPARIAAAAKAACAGLAFEAPLGA